MDSLWILPPEFLASISLVSLRRTPQQSAQPLSHGPSPAPVLAVKVLLLGEQLHRTSSGQSLQELLGLSSVC